MDSNNKHVERVVAALVIVIIALVMVVVHLAVSGKPDPSTASPAISSPAISSPVAMPPAAMPPVASAPRPVPTAPALPPFVHKQNAPLNISSNVSPTLLAAEDIGGKTVADLRLMRNEIYARHGYRFRNPSLLTYFEAKPWYHPDTGDMQVAEKRMSSVEMANTAFLAQREHRDKSQGREAIRVPAAPRPPPVESFTPPAAAVNPPPVTEASTPAPAGAASIQVWVNTRTGIYHYPGQRWYGNTAQGQYMTEEDAKAAGYRAAENGQ